MRRLARIFRTLCTLETLLLLFGMWALALATALSVLALSGLLRREPPGGVFGFTYGAAFVVPVTVLLVLNHRYGIRRRRCRAGLCSRCGYDLRASPVRCPECGS